MELAKFFPDKEFAHRTPNILILGPRRSGKTTLAKDLLTHLEDGHVEVLCRHKIDYESYEFPSRFLVFDYTTEQQIDRHLNTLYINQCNRIEKARQQRTLSYDPCCLTMIYDGITPVTKLGHMFEVMSIYNYPNNIQSILVHSFPKEVFPNSYAHYDFIFCFYSSQLSYKMKLYEKFYRHQNTSFEEFCQRFESLQDKPYTCFVIKRGITPEYFSYKTDSDPLSLVRSQIRCSCIKQELLSTPNCG